MINKGDIEKFVSSLFEVNKNFTESWLISSLNSKDLEQLKSKFIDYLQEKFKSRMDQFILFSSLNLDEECISLLIEFSNSVGQKQTELLESLKAKIQEDSANEHFLNLNVEQKYDIIVRMSADTDFRNVADIGKIRSLLKQKILEYIRPWVGTVVDIAKLFYDSQFKQLELKTQEIKKSTTNETEKIVEASSKLYLIDWLKSDGFKEELSNVLFKLIKNIKDDVTVWPQQPLNDVEEFLNEIKDTIIENLGNGLQYNNKEKFDYIEEIIQNALYKCIDINDKNFIARIKKIKEEYRDALEKDGNESNDFVQDVLLQDKVRQNLGELQIYQYKSNKSKEKEMSCFERFGKWLCPKCFSNKVTPIDESDTKKDIKNYIDLYGILKNYTLENPSLLPKIIQDKKKNDSVANERVALLNEHVNDTVLNQSDGSKEDDNHGDIQKSLVLQEGGSFFERVQSSFRSFVSYISSPSSRDEVSDGDIEMNESGRDGNNSGIRKGPISEENEDLDKGEYDSYDEEGGEKESGRFEYIKTIFWDFCNFTARRGGGNSGDVNRDRDGLDEEEMVGLANVRVEQDNAPDEQQGVDNTLLVGAAVIAVAGGILYVNGNLADAAHAIEEVVVEIIGDHN